MAATIIDFPGLKTAVETWREQAGEAVVQNNVEDCILLGEARLTRDLPLNRMWTNETLYGVDQSRELDLPADFVEAEYLKLTTGDRFDEVKRRSPATMRYYSSPSTNPDKWCINGDVIDLNRPCSGALTFLLRYRMKFTLSTQKPKNWLLTNHPDIYLAAVLMESGLLLKDDDVAVWGGKLNSGIASLLDLDSKVSNYVELDVRQGFESGFYDADTDTVIA